MITLGLVALCFVTAVLSQACPQWGYDDTLPTGPSNWGKLCERYHLCNDGRTQSPIDLVNTTKVYGTDVLSHKYVPTVNGTFAIIDYGYEIIYIKEKDTLSAFGLDGYVLLEFHFHAPAEHLVNGKRYPLEIHLVHATRSYNYAVLGFFYDISNDTKPNTFLQTLIPYIPSINPNGSVLVSSIDINDQINYAAGGFYHYSGSLTIPPCMEGVDFFISTTPNLADSATLAPFLSGMNNARPLQPLNNRTVTLYAPKATTASIEWAYALGVGGVGLLLIGAGTWVVARYRRRKNYDNLDFDMLIIKK